MNDQRKEERLAGSGNKGRIIRTQDCQCGLEDQGHSDSCAKMRQIQTGPRDNLRAQAHGNRERMRNDGSL